MSVEFDLSMYVVCSFDMFMSPFNWNALIALRLISLSCSDSSPYKSFERARSIKSRSQGNKLRHND